MPRVPTYNQPQVRQAAIPDVRQSGNVSPEAFGAGRARDIQQLGKSAENLGIAMYESQAREERQVRAARVREQFEKAQQEHNRYVQTNVSSLTGEEATHAYDLADKNSEEVRTKYGGQFTDERDRAMFDASFSDYKTGVLNSVGEFERKSKQQYVAATLQAENKTAVDSAKQYRNNPDLVAFFDKSVEANTRELYKDDPLREQYVQDAKKHMYTEIIAEEYKQSPVQGLASLEEHKDKLGNEVYAAMKNGMEKAKVEKEVNDRADQLSTLPISMQEKALEGIGNPEMQKGVRHAVDLRNAAKEKAKTQQEDFWYESEYNKLVKAPAAYRVPLSGPADKREHLRNVQAGMIKPGTQQTDWQYYNQLVNKKPEELKTTTLDKSKLADTEFKQLSKLQANGGGMAETQSLNTWLNTFVKQNEPKDYEKATALRAEAERLLNEYPESQRKTQKARNEVAKYLTMDVEVAGETFAGGQKYYEAKRKGETVVGPTERPPGLPKDAQWQEGKHRRGWTFTNPAGARMFQDFDTGEIHSW